MNGSNNLDALSKLADKLTYGSNLHTENALSGPNNKKIKVIEVESPSKKKSKIMDNLSLSNAKSEFSLFLPLD